MTDRCISQEHQMAAQLRRRLAAYPVSEQVVLAGQPQPHDWAQLAEQGFGTILNIRTDPEKAACQAKEARAAGLDYIHLPLPAYELETEHLHEFNQAVERANHGRLLIHCRSASRTGLLWILKRVELDGWTPERAESELRAAGYGDDNIDTFLFCADDYFERAASPSLELVTTPLF